MGVDEAAGATVQQAGVAAQPLGLVERRVGELDELLRRAALDLGKARDSGGQGQGYRGALDLELERLDLLAQPLGDGERGDAVEALESSVNSSPP